MKRLPPLTEEDWGKLNCRIEKSLPEWDIRTKADADRAWASMTKTIKEEMQFFEKNVKRNVSEKTKYDKMVMKMMEEDHIFAHKFLTVGKNTNTDAPHTEKFKLYEEQKRTMWQKKVQMAPKMGNLWSFLATAEYKDGGTARKAIKTPACMGTMENNGVVATTSDQKVLLAKHFATRGKE